MPVQQSVSLLTAEEKNWGFVLRVRVKALAESQGQKLPLLSMHAVIALKSTGQSSL